MNDKLTVEKIADEMYTLVTECTGKKNLMAGDLIKAMHVKFGDTCTKRDCKRAIRRLVDSGRCIYSYVGESYIVLPPHVAPTPSCSAAEAT
jgi:outer membrane protein assembly factor BamA